MSTALLKITGHVQGVFYRAHAQEEAKKLGLKGYAKNLPEGSVEALVQGPEEKIKQFINWAKEGSPRAEVKNVEIKWDNVEKEFPDFEIF